MTVRVVGRLSPAQRRELTQDLVVLLYTDHQRRGSPSGEPRPPISNRPSAPAL